jgi:hypothetical protein
MKRVLVALILVAVFAPLLHLFAQEPTQLPLAVRVKLVSLDLESNESWLLKYQATVELRYTNLIDRPVIFLRNELDVMHEAYAEWGEDGKVSFSAEEYPPDVLYQQIDAPEPPPDHAVILKPGGEYTVRVKVPLNLRRTGLNDIHFQPKSLHASLHLTLEPWSSILGTSKFPEVEDLGPHELLAFVKTRWVATGEIVDTEFDAEPIEFDLPIPAAVPQSSGLVLRGKLVGWEKPEDGDGFIDLVADLELEFLNTGTTPVLVLKPEYTGYGDYVLGSIDLQGAPVKGGIRETIFNSAAWYSRDTSEKWQQMHSSMESATSPEEHFWIIQPSSSRFFRHAAGLRIDKAKNSSFPPQDPWPVVKKKLQTYEQLWFVVQIQIWPHNLETGYDPDIPTLGRELRQHWSKVGVLELGEDGIFESERIPIKAPTGP